MSHSHITRRSNFLQKTYYRKLANLKTGLGIWKYVLQSKAREDNDALTNDTSESDLRLYPTDLPWIVAIRIRYCEAIFPWRIKYTIRQQPVSDVEVFLKLFLFLVVSFGILVFDLDNNANLDR